MLVPAGTTVAVADGGKLSLFRSTGSETHTKLTAIPVAAVSTDNMGSGARHGSSSANPDDRTQDEDAFAAGTAALLNSQAIDGTIKGLVIIAAPRALGELRKHYHKKLQEVLLGEIAKDLTGHTSDDIEKAISAA